MFCVTCGNSLEHNYNFCPKCGSKSSSSSERQQPATTATESTSTGSKIPTFKEFRAKKEKERASQFRPNSKGKRKRNVENLQDSVTVNVGIMLFDGSELKKQRGQSLGVSVKKATTTEELLNACLAKQKAHAKDVIKESIKYYLLYSDGTKVDKLKETDEAFVLYKYKAECGKAYNRISFFLCPQLDFSQAGLANCLRKDADFSSSCSELSDSDTQATRVAKRSNVKNTESESEEGKTSGQPFVELTAREGPGTRSTSSPRPNVHNHGTQLLLPDMFKEANLQVSDGSQGHGSDYATLMDMFPLLNAADVYEALATAEYNMEAAIDHILSRSVKTTSEQVYAGFDFCNDIQYDEEFQGYESSTACSSERASVEVESADDTPLSDLINNLSARNIKSEAPLRIKVRRSHVWEDAKFKIKKCSESDLDKLIKVQFVGEPAVDQGGPRNEFFSLLHKEMCTSSLFIGDPGKKCFGHNIIALEQGDFRMYGQLCSMGIIQGSPSPCFLAPAVVDYILYGKLDKVSTCTADLYQMPRQGESWKS